MFTRTKRVYITIFIAMILICGGISDKYERVCPGVVTVLADTKTESAGITDTAMGTDCSVLVYADEKKAKQTAQDVMDMLSYIEEKHLSWRIEGSDIANVNKNASDGNSYETSEWTWGYLEKILDLSEKSDGAFDPTLGEISTLWNLGTDNPYIPQKKEIVDLLKKTGWEKVILEDGKVALGDEVRIDLGAVGKGIGCDEAKKLLEDTDIQAAVVSVGGSILTYGKKVDSRPWKVAISNPRKDNSQSYLGILTIEGNAFISTSGDYEKYVIEDGVRYHHILDPQTGYPADSGLISVTIVCDEGWLSDGLSTACFVLGYDKSLSLLEKYGAEAIFVTDEKEVMVTEGLKDIFSLTDETMHLRETLAEMESSSELSY